ncbi:MAG: hypothetical protein AAFP90_22035, partial [Planctomycetota bacterium]
DAGNMEKPGDDARRSDNQQPGDQQASGSNQSQGGNQNSGDNQSGNHQRNPGENGKDSQQNTQRGDRTNRQNGSRSDSPGRQAANSESSDLNQPSLNNGAPDSASQGNDTMSGSQENPTNGPTQRPSQSAPSNGAGGDTSDASADGRSPSNEEYTKEATDMVLDYLRQNRDNPDQKMLDELNWTKDDMQRFADRWEKVRDLPQGASETQRRQANEAMKSLGIRPPRTTSGNRRGTSDGFRGLIDGGNRPAPPASFQDLFNAFRRRPR